MAELKIVYKKTDNLIPYENNPRNNDNAVPAVAASIKDFGFKVPILLDKDNVIIAGHTRLKAAKKLGMKMVPCIYADDLTPQQVKALRIADNKTAELAEWDAELLDSELAEITDFDMSSYGFNSSELDELLAEPDEVKEDEFDAAPPEKPKSQRGDLYCLGDHMLLCGDATNPEYVQCLLGGDKVDLYLTDPPYNVALGMGGSQDEARKRHRRTDGLVIMNDKMDSKDFRQFLTAAFSCAKQHMNSGAAFYIWHADNESYNFRGAVADAGLTLRQTVIWNKNSMTLGRQDYQWKHEPCLYGWNEGTHHWYSDRKQTTVIDMARPTKSTEHPTMKPVELFAYQIKNSSKQGDVVYDSFGGSGTTMIACEQLGRKARLMELDPRYVDVIVNRWETMSGKKAVLKGNYLMEKE